MDHPPLRRPPKPPPMNTHLSARPLSLKLKVSPRFFGSRGVLFVLVFADGVSGCGVGGAAPWAAWAGAGGFRWFRGSVQDLSDTGIAAADPAGGELIRCEGLLPGAAQIA